MNAFSLQVNGNAFVIQSDGSLYVNGTQLIDGPNKSIIVYDDQIRQRSVRASVSDVTSGNIGSTDTKLFGNPQNVSKPLSFDDLANRTFIRNAIAGAQNTSWWI